MIAAGIGATVVGFLWYSPALFGKPWMKHMGYTASDLKKEQKQMGKYYAITMLLSFVTAYVLFHVMTFSYSFYNYPMLETGIMSAFYMWLGFIMPVQASNTIFGDKNWTLFGINTGYQLAAVMVTGIILGMMG